MTVAAPSVINDHDSAKYSVSFAGDPAIAFGAEDDFQITRPRYTRPASREHTIGFTFVTDAVKKQIEDLWLNAKGGSSFISGFVDPVSKASLTVRFKKGSIPQFKYRGYRNAPYWDISGIVFQEV